MDDAKELNAAYAAHGYIATNDFPSDSEGLGSLNNVLDATQVCNSRATSRDHNTCRLTNRVEWHCRRLC